ncbi:MAG TPA: VWA domain-containing protein [Rhizomicrobium sp.]|nr:VWA domain-containing protein [Rhizomicrobium sp.]
MNGAFLKINAVLLALGVTGLFALAACSTKVAEPESDEITVAVTQEKVLAKPPAPPPPPAEFAIAPNVTMRATAGAPMSMPLTIAPAPPYWQADNTSRFPQAQANPIKVAADEPVSTFSIDVDTASYGVVRGYLSGGAMPPADAVRVEEMVNYFDYAYPQPETREEPFHATYRVYPTPWNPETRILHIGIKGFDLPKRARPPANLVFLIDTSGSMQEPNKLPLLKSAFRLLVDQLSEKDRVAIVTYAGSAGVVLEPTSGADHGKIMLAIDKLEAGGSTAGGEGIRLAYKLAEDGRIEGGVNRVLLATDGDFNVGITDPKALEGFVTAKRDAGVALTCLGFGNDNYNDDLMQKMAQAGNGNAAFIDTINEARKVFVEQVSGTLFTIAKDVKIQIEFNPARVAEYRLIGYETRMLNRTDFNDDRVDAGDIGSGHTVTALYEITPVGSKAQMADALRYGRSEKAGAKARMGGELAFLKIRYKLPSEDASRLITRPITDADAVEDFASVPADMRFAAAVAGSAELMRHDPYVKGFGYDAAIRIAENAAGDDRFGYRKEFVALLREARKSEGMKPLDSQHSGG